jgi:hypothetical protein
VAASGYVVGDEVGTEPLSEDENANSVALLIEMGPFRYFAGGDLEEHTEGRLAERDAVLDVDVYHANHHGSHLSSTAPFLDDLAPAVVVVSHGVHATYQHPRRVTLERFAALDAPPLVFQTNQYIEHPGDEEPDLWGSVADSLTGDPELVDFDGDLLVAYDAATGMIAVSFRDFRYVVPVKARGPVAGVVIERLLPDPVGLDTQLEAVTLRNDGAALETLAGWRLRDWTGLEWSLSAFEPPEPGGRITVVRAGRAMSLNNFGDTITLLDAEGAERDRFEYGPTEEGVEIETGH